MDLEQILLADGLGLTSGYPRVAQAVGLVAHRLSDYSEVGFSISHAPLEDNPYHGEARTGAGTSAARRAARTLADTVEIIVPIDPALAAELGAEPL